MASREEAMGARLYTGPMFTKYNAVLRGVSDDSPPALKQAFKEMCRGNK